MRSTLVDLDALVERAQELAPLPASALRLAGLLADEDWDVAAVCEIVRFDEALTGRLLGAANSARSAPRAPITSVDQAVARLGAGVVLSLGIGPSVRPVMQAAVPEYGLDEGELWRHSVAAALTVDEARRFSKWPVEPHAFAAALLHDVGKLALARLVPTEALTSMSAARDEEGLSVHEAEEAVLRTSHAQVGALVARGWKLPEVIVSGIEHHHTPLSGGDRATRRLCQQIALADAVSQRIGESPGDGSDEPGFDAALAGVLGITQAGFEELCERVRTNLDEVLALYGGA